jgi:hypothetical protein
VDKVQLRFGTPRYEITKVKSAGLDIGLAIGTIFVFFVRVQCEVRSFQAFTVHEIEFPAWWGTEVIKNTADVLRTPLRILKPGLVLFLQKLMEVKLSVQMRGNASCTTDRRNDITSIGLMASPFSYQFFRRDSDI